MKNYTINEKQAMGLILTIFSVVALIGIADHGGFIIAPMILMAIGILLISKGLIFTKKQKDHF